MLNKIILRLIGLFAFFIGIASLYQVIVELLTTPSQPLIATINSVVLACIAIFGGYQTAKLTSGGKKLLCVYFMLRIWGTILFLGGLIFAWMKVGENLSIEPSQQPSVLIYMGYFVFSVIALVLLLKKDSAGVFGANIDFRQREIVGKVLCLLTPGLGRAFLGNIWAGFALFIAYSVVIGGEFYLKIDSLRSYPLALFLFDILFDVIIWMIFAWVDWKFVKNVIMSQKGEATLAPMMYSEQKGG
jgi:hypothetical protein